jgi:hypothetical protein
MASATAEYDMILKEFNNVREACKSASRPAEEMWYFRTVSGPQGSKDQKELRELRDLFKTKQGYDRWFQARHAETRLCGG